jgi:GNAT superfamily N-acetyltransferase
MEFVDVSKRMAEPRIQEIFALAVGYPTPEKLDGLARAYAREPTGCAFALFDAGEPLGVIVLERGSAGSARIRYISVTPANQRAGIGRRLMQEVREREALNELRAETHIDAVPFYRRCGFEVASLGELWPGVERFECCWRRT